MDCVEMRAVRLYPIYSLPKQQIYEKIV